MKTGRPAKPTAIKELEGNPGRRPLNKREPKPRVTTPACPAWLQGEGRKEYRRVAKMLTTLRVMTEADRTALAAYAREYALWREADEYAERNGQLEIGEKGNAYMSPMVGIANMHFKNMLKLMSEFGLTPSSRTRIVAQPEEQREKSLAEKLFIAAGAEVGD